MMSSTASFIIWVVIEVVLIYLIVVVLVAVQVGLANDLPTDEKLADPLDIQTGDILGVGYRNPFGWFVTAWSFSVWSHTGVAWRCPDTNQVYVFEAARYGKNYNGVFRIPYDLWLRINRKSYLCHLRLQRTDPHHMGDIIDARKMDEQFKVLEKINLDTFNWHWYRLLLQRPYKEETLDRHYTCYEVSIMLLQRMGVVAKKYTCHSYFARDLVWRHVDMEPEYVYSDPIMLRVPHIP